VLDADAAERTQHRTRISHIAQRRRLNAHRGFDDETIDQGPRGGVSGFLRTYESFGHVGGSSKPDTWHTAREIPNDLHEDAAEVRHDVAMSGFAVEWGRAGGGGWDGGASTQFTSLEEALTSVASATSDTVVWKPQ
jgi:hypothetical protein